MRHEDGYRQVRLQPPPPGLMKVVNPLVRRVLTIPGAGKRLTRPALLEFSGHRSGKRYRVPVILHDIDGVAIVFTARPWRLNFVDGAGVVVTQRGVVRSGRGQLLTASPEDGGKAMRAALDNGASYFDLGLKVRRGVEPTADDLAEIAPSLIRIDFTKETASCE